MSVPGRLYSLSTSQSAWQIAQQHFRNSTEAKQTSSWALCTPDGVSCTVLRGRLCTPARHCAAQCTYTQFTSYVMHIALHCAVLHSAQAGTQYTLACGVHIAQICCAAFCIGTRSHVVCPRRRPLLLLAGSLGRDFDPLLMRLDQLLGDIRQQQQHLGGKGGEGGGGAGVQGSGKVDDLENALTSTTRVRANKGASAYPAACTEHLTCIVMTYFESCYLHDARL